MNQKQIIDWAREAGWIIRDDLHYMDHQAMQDALVERIERFAALVAAAAKAEENEACAKVCDDLAFDWHKNAASGPGGAYNACAAAIRARGQNELL